MYIHVHSEPSPPLLFWEIKKYFHYWNRVLEGNLTVCIKNFKIPYSFNITPKTILVASLKEYAGLYAKVSFKALFRRVKQQKAKQSLKYISHVQKEGIR